MKLDTYPRRGTLGDPMPAGNEVAQLERPIFMTAAGSGDCSSCALAAQAMAQAQPLVADSAPVPQDAAAAAPAAASGGHDWLLIGLAVFALWELSKPRRARAED